MSVVRMGRQSSNEPPMEFDFPDWLTATIFMGLCEDSYREDDLLIDIEEEGDVEDGNI